MSNKKCKIAQNIVIDGKMVKVVDPQDACAAVQRVLAKHQGLEVISPKEYEALTKKTQ